MPASGFGNLGLDERRSLFRREPMAEIAFCLGRHRSTIFSELARDRYRGQEHTGDHQYNRPRTARPSRLQWPMHPLGLVAEPIFRQWKA